MIMLKIRTLPPPSISLSRMSAAITIDAVTSILAFDFLNPWGEMTASRNEECYILSLAPSSSFPGDPAKKQIDLGEAMETALESSRATARKPALPPLTVRLAFEGTDSAFPKFLWPKRR